MSNPMHQSLLASKSNTLALTKYSDPAPAQSQDAFSIPFLVAFIVILIICILLIATFWPVNEHDPSRRQRKYARIDQLYFPVQGALVTKESIEEIRSISNNSERVERYFESFLPIEFRVTSLSLGGCAIKAERALEKGQIILLNLGQLPDYPKRYGFVSFKVTWIRNPKNPNRDSLFDVGLQISDTFQEDTKDTLRKYLNYLLDDPAA
jgi:hypothetical protein